MWMLLNQNLILISLYDFQEKGSEKTLYGIDDINDAAEIIIVTSISPVL